MIGRRSLSFSRPSLLRVLRNGFSPSASPRSGLWLVARQVAFGVVVRMSGACLTGGDSSLGSGSDIPRDHAFPSPEGPVVWEWTEKIVRFERVSWVQLPLGELVPIAAFRAYRLRGSQLDIAHGSDNAPRVGRSKHLLVGFHSIDVLRHLTSPLLLRIGPNRLRAVGYPANFLNDI